MILEECRIELGDANGIKVLAEFVSSENLPEAVKSSLSAIANMSQSLACRVCACGFII